MRWEVYDDAGYQQEVEEREEGYWNQGVSMDSSYKRLGSYVLKSSFSQGSSMDRTKVASIQTRQRHNSFLHLDLGGRVQLKSGLGDRQRSAGSSSKEH